MASAFCEQRLDFLHFKSAVLRAHFSRRQATARRNIERPPAWRAATGGGYLALAAGTGERRNIDTDLARSILPTGRHFICVQNFLIPAPGILCVTLGANE